MDDDIKRALEQARGLSVTDEIAGATQSAQDLIYGPAGSAVRRVWISLTARRRCARRSFGYANYTT